MSQTENAPGHRDPSVAQATQGPAAHDAVAAEPDSPPVGKVFLAVLAAAVVLGGLLVGIQEMFDQGVRKRVVARQLAVTATPLRELRAKEIARLGRYQWVDRAAGVVRIPTERAAELLLVEWKTDPNARPRIEAPVEPAPAAQPERGRGAAKATKGGK